MLAEFGPLFANFSRYVMLFPGVTGLGDPVLVMLRSYCPADATVTFAVALLLEGFESGVAVEVLAVSEITVPEAVPDATFTTSVNVDVAPGASVPIVHVTFPPEPGLGQLHTVPVCANEKNVVFVGTVSLNVTVVAAEGPWFVTVMTYVMLFPACTGFGEAALVTTMFAVLAAATSVTTVAVLFARFGSLDPDDTESVSVICVPLTVAGDTCTTSVKVPTAPFATSGFVQPMFPDAPTAGVVHDHPGARTNDW